MPRASWKGFVRLSLVSVPVQAFTASATGQSRVTLNQLHEECGSRIRYQKVCPIHGEVSKDEIVRGYEYAKGQYAVIDLDELEKLRTEADKSINLDHFFDPAQLDPRYFSGQCYYLTPDGPAGQKPYSLLCEAMVEKTVYAVGQFVLSGKEQLVVLRPLDGLLAVNTLQYPSELKDPASFHDEIAEVKYSAKELNLTKTLVEATTAEELDLAQYADLYTERLTELIEAKVAGKEIVVPPEEEPAGVINLMDALRASVEQRKKATGKEKTKRPKLARSTAQRKGKKKKTG